jgi:RNA polymerase sigma-70 factor (ECF subfamily)
MTFALDPMLHDRAIAGDRAALDTLVRALQPHIERQLMRYPVTEEDRHDLLQSTMMQVLRRLGSFRGDSSFSTWLFRVTANEALMLMRSQRRLRTRFIEGLDFEDLASLPAMSTSEQGEAGDVGAANRQRDERVREALEELPEDYRELVMAHYHMDLNLDEIAGRFELSESAVRSRLHRARARLRSILEQTPVAQEVMEGSRVRAARGADTSTVSKLRRPSVMPAARAA